MVRAFGSGVRNPATSPLLEPSSNSRDEFSSSARFTAELRAIWPEQNKTDIRTVRDDTPRLAHSFRPGAWRLEWAAEATREGVTAAVLILDHHAKGISPGR